MKMWAVVGTSANHTLPQIDEQVKSETQIQEAIAAIENFSKELEKLNHAKEEDLKSIENDCCCGSISKLIPVPLSYHLLSLSACSVLIGIGDFFFSMVGLNVMGDEIKSKPSDLISVRLYGYMMNNQNEPWMQAITLSTTLAEIPINPETIAEHLKLTCNTATGFLYTHHLGFSPPETITPGVTLSAFGLSTGGYLLGIVGTYLTTMLGWKEAPLSIREHGLLTGHLARLRQHQNQYQFNVENSDLEMLNVADEVSPQDIQNAITTGDQISRVQWKVYASNTAYVCSLGIIAVILRELFLAGVERATDLIGYDQAGFDTNAEISHRCLEDSPLNLSFGMYTVKFPIPGGVEYLRSFPPTYVSKTDFDNYSNMLTVPMLIFSALPIFVSMVINVYLATRHFYKTK